MKQPLRLLAVCLWISGSLAAQTTFNGTVFNDFSIPVKTQNGTEAGIDGTASGPLGTLFVNLVEGGAVIGSSPVSAAGAYTITVGTAGFVGRTLVLASTASATTPLALPSPWVFMGEGGGLDAGANGIVTAFSPTVAGTTTNVFGLQQTPIALDKIETIGVGIAVGTIWQLDGTLLEGTDPEQGTLQVGDDFRVIVGLVYLPGGAPVPTTEVQLLYDINGTLTNIGGGDEINNYDPFKLFLKFNGLPTSQTLRFTYNVFDGVNIPSATPANFTINIPTILPAQGFELSGKLTGKAVDLEWQTLSEQNTRQFVVQRSRDGNQFTDIGAVQAAGNSISKKLYPFTDPKPVSDLLFYRIKLIDNDGRTGFSNTVVIRNIPFEGEVRAFPNPVRSTLFIEFSKPGSYSVELLNMSGQRVAVRQADIGSNLSNLSISRGSMMPGIYLARIVERSTGTVQTLKFMVE